MFCVRTTLSSVPLPYAYLTDVPCRQRKYIPSHASPLRIPCGVDWPGRRALQLCSDSEGPPWQHSAA